PRGTHALRRAFISLARSDGARKDVLEVVTHNAAGAVIDLYTSLEWQTLFEAGSCLRFELHRAEVLELPKKKASGGGEGGGSEGSGGGGGSFAQPLAQGAGAPQMSAGSGWRCRESNTPAGAPNGGSSRLLA